MKTSLENAQDIKREVEKNQTADLIAGGISGTVNLITRKPFDSNERIVSFTAKGSYGDMVEDIAPAFSGLFSDSWETGAGESGFLISVSESEFTAHGDGVAVEIFMSAARPRRNFPPMALPNSCGLIRPTARIA